MSYTAIEAMRKKNAERFHADIGPHRPPYFPGEESRPPCAFWRNAV